MDRERQSVSCQLTVFVLIAIVIASLYFAHARMLEVGSAEVVPDAESIFSGDEFWKWSQEFPEAVINVKDYIPMMDQCTEVYNCEVSYEEDGLMVTFYTSQDFLEEVNSFLAGAQVTIH